MNMRLQWVWMLLPLLVACDPLKQYQTDPGLAGMTAVPQSTSPKCASCHAYPLRDVNHVYHLMSTNTGSSVAGMMALNGSISCMDCHLGSIAHFKYLAAETTWVDKDGFPSPVKVNPTDTVGKIDYHSRLRPRPIGFDTLAHSGAEVDSLIAKAKALGSVVEWVTAVNHFNGKVDVQFAPNSLTDPALAATAYNPSEMSCSAIACHNNPEVRYRWPSQSRGIRGCPSLSGRDTSCGEAATGP